ncbi:MAG: hypothetical protein ACAH17_00595, partial [Candidatus Paceibacterota bacterium]
GLSGRVPLKVSTENGPIAVGDRIVLSNVPGVGMKEGGTSTEAVVGIALESFDGNAYLSPATIEAETGKVATGNTVCTTRLVTSNLKMSGGNDIEGTTVTPKGNGYEEVCVREQNEVIPLAGVAQNTTVEGREVKIGKVLVFIALEKTHKVTSPGLVWEDNGDTLALQKAIDMVGKNILNVGKLTSANGSWSIDENGNIRARSVTAQNIYAEEMLQIGSEAKPTGMTLFDKVSGAPYCLEVSGGSMNMTAGRCGSVLGVTAETPPPTETPPDDPAPPSEEPDTPSPENAEENPSPEATEEPAPPEIEEVSVPPSESVPEVEN